MRIQDTGKHMSRVLHRSTISVSVPPPQQEAFYRALMRLQKEDGAAFVSASALIVDAVIQYARGLDTRDAPHETPTLHLAPDKDTNLTDWRTHDERY